MDPRNQQQKQDQQRPQGPNAMGPGCGMSSLAVWIMIGLAVIALAWGPVQNYFSDRDRITYSQFRGYVQQGEVEKVTVSGDRIQGELTEPSQEQDEEAARDFTKFFTYLPSFGDQELLTMLETQGVEIQTEPEADFNFGTLLINFLPLALLAGFVYVIFRQRQGGGGNMLSMFSMGESQAQLYDREDEPTTFEDVAGLHGPKTELKEIISFLKEPERFQRLGGETPHGLLLVGPPGTGKTLLARAAAGEADVPFYSISGSSFMEMFVGVGASRVRDLFEKAKEESPSIVFIDELDSIGRSRGAGLGGGHDEREQTLNQLLAEMDGFEPQESVIVMAATNRPDILDPALLRPGRFDRRVTINLPTLEDREKILQLHARDKEISEEVDLERIARSAAGFSGADLENLLNEAALLAARKEKEAIEPEDLEDARDKVMMGLERESLALTEEECRMLAYHESGHAVLAAVLPHADPIHKVTIVPRGKAMGVTQQLPERERYIYRRDYMMDRLAVMLGGRASEDLNLDTFTSGAENDLKQATKLARRMVMDWGMSERLGHMALGGRQEQVFLGEEIAQRREFSEETARVIDEEIKAILDQAYQRARSTLEKYSEGLEKLVERLQEIEEVPGEEVKELIGLENSESSGEAGEEQG
jgi:cell division protease FtsH